MQAADLEVEAFFEAIPDARRRDDCRTLCAVMTEATGAPPKLWGPSIVGFGRYRYTYANGRTGESCLVGFAPRKRNLTLYILSGFDAYEALLGRLGKHTTGKVCLYVNGLAGLDLDVLKQLIRESVAHMIATNP